MSKPELENADPYSAPLSLLAQEDGNPLDDFKRFSAWGVFGLLVVTVGIYYVYWLYTRSQVLAQYKELEISPILINVVLAAYAGIFAFSFYLGMNPGDARLISVVNILQAVMTIANLIWLFTFRSRLNKLSGLKRGDGGWAGPILTFFFHVIYLQYKINKIKDGEAK